MCGDLNKVNEDLKKEVDKLKKQNSDLEYKYEGLLECKTDIYKKYQDLIIKNPRQISLFTMVYHTKI